MIDDVLAEAGDQMKKAVAHTREDFSTVRTGRASPALVDKLIVDAYGSDLPLQQIANFSVPEARQLVIAPFDKANIPAIEKAIMLADLGLNPSSDGNIIRLSFPSLTEERRKEMVRVVRGLAEDGRISLRNHRRSARHDLEAWQKEGEISEDDLKRGEKQLDDLTHKFEAEIDDALAQKETELLEV